MSLIRWTGLDSARIESAIKALIVRLHPDARPIDGRGGDGGRDVRWDSPTGLVIFEIKSFVDRLNAAQKRQIKESLREAATHNPVGWILILPLDHSPAEETWFDGLAQLYPGIQLEWRGVSWLNEQFAPHEDLRRLVEDENYELLQRAAEFGREQAVVATINDGLQRVAGVTGRMRELSPFWRADIITGPDGIGVIYNERQPGSGALDPLHISARFTVPVGDQAGQHLPDQLKDFFNYGGQVDVAGRYVTEFDVTSQYSQSLFDTSRPTTRLRFTSATVQNNPNPLTYQLVIVSAAGAVRTRIPLVMSQPTTANRGARTVGGDQAGLFEAVITADRAEHGGIVTCDLRMVSPGGKLPYAIRPSLDAFRHVADDDTIEVRINDEHRIPAGDAAAFLAEARLRAEFVCALETLQNQTGDLFPVPDELPAHHVRDVIFAAQLTIGTQVRSHGNSLKLALRPTAVADFADQFGKHDDGGIRFDLDNYTIQCGEHEIPLGPVTITGPKARLTNVDDLRAAAASGQAIAARIDCYDGEGFYFQLAAQSI